MKPVKLLLAGAMVAGALAAYAQDSTQVTPPAPPVQQQDQATPQDQMREDQMNFKKDMVVIRSAEVPASLRNTLQGDQYKGWESGTIYRTQSSDMFIVEIRDGDKIKMHRFDQNGKPIKDY